MISFKKFLVELAFKKDDLSQLDPEDIGSSHEVQKYRDKEGSIFFVKTPSQYLYQAYNDSVMHILVEYLSYEIYRIFGIKVPFADLYIKNNQILLASKESKGKHVSFRDLPKYKDFVKGFVPDLFISNWDVGGSGEITGNLLIDQDGNVTRIDPGGALLFRARGGRKFDKFSKHVGEFDSMRDNDTSQVADSYNSHPEIIKQSFQNFFKTSWSVLKNKLEVFNKNNILLPINELIQDSDIKTSILEEWDVLFEEIIYKLEHRYSSLLEIANKNKFL